MQMEQPLSEKVQWLMDRALISDLLYSFARSLDSRDIETYINNYTGDGLLELPDPTSATGETIAIPRSSMKEFVPNGLFKAYSATHHISTNHQITITGDTATSRSYLQAVHVGKGPMDHWDAGG
jgi:hypothetical protein